MSNNSVIIKSKKATQEELEQINQFTTRKFEEEELYIFSVILCDNEIDRDFEQFPSESLQKLKKLFVGKTGIFDHNPKGENQTARIFATQLIKDSTRINQLGEPYEYLLAKAYMIKSEKNKNLILEVEGGIKKEVSIGCSVSKKVCGLCGKDLAKYSCEHKKGKIYPIGEGKIAFVKLLNPTDAYEFSFVAIPAQRRAGVTKKFQKIEKQTFETKEYKKFLEEKKAFEKFKKEQQDFIEVGKEFVQVQKREFVTQISLQQKNVKISLIQEIVKKLSLEELKELRKCFLRESIPNSQFDREEDTHSNVVNQFKI